MRIVTTLLSLVFASALLGGCAAKAKVRVGDTTNPTTSPSKVAGENQGGGEAMKADAEGAAETPAGQPETGADTNDVPARD